MTAEIKAQDGKILTVEFNNGGEKWTKRIDMNNQSLEPYALKVYFDNYCQAYLRGKELEEVPNVVGQKFDTKEEAVLPSPVVI